MVAARPALDQADATERTPPAGWPGWASRAATLRTYLATPRGRTWPELHAWARREGISVSELTNRLAALENMRAVVGVGPGREVRWVATGQGQACDPSDDDGVITSAPRLPRTGPCRRS